MEEDLRKIIDKISKVRKNKGYSYDNMAIDMGLSPSAYRKIEMVETKLTVERLLQIAEVLDSPLDSLFENNDKKNFNQENHDNETVNAYQGNSYPDISALTNKILSIYEKQIEELKSEIKDLKNLKNDKK